MTILNRARIFASPSSARASTPRRRAVRGFRPEASPLEGRRLLATFMVTNTSGSASDQGSLPWAVEQANYHSAGLDVITFNIPGAGPHVIRVTDTLYLNEQTVVDATTQPGYAGSPLVTIHGGGTPASIFLLQQQSSGSTIQGFAMVGYTANAVTIFNTSQGNWIQNNYMGFAYDAAGRIQLNNAYTTQPTAGVGIQSSFNTIRWNTISGVYNGVNVGEDIGGTWSGTNYKTNSIQWNQIGTDPTGATAAGFGNDSDGIFLGAGASENFLGPENVLSGNKSSGAEMLHPSNKGNVVFANRIGLDRAGTAAIPNGEVGVLLANGATGNAVGGPFGGNFIAANPLGGIVLGTSAWGAASANWVQNNVVGLNAGQTAIVGSQNVGITVENGSSVNSITGNVVAGSLSHGFLLSQATGNYVASNWIGQSYSGAAFPNQVYGVVLLSSSRQNWIWQNAFGANGRGTVYADASSTGNAIS